MKENVKNTNKSPKTGEYSRILHNRSSNLRNRDTIGKYDKERYFKN